MTSAPSQSSELLQFAILTALLGWSVFFMLRRTFPAQIAKLQQWLANRAQALGWPKLAAWLSPAISSSASGCGSGCSNCSTCGANPAATEQPVQWKTPPSKSSGCH